MSELKNPIMQVIGSPLEKGVTAAATLTAKPVANLVQDVATIGSGVADAVIGPASDIIEDVAEEALSPVQEITKKLTNEKTPEQLAAEAYNDFGGVFVWEYCNAPPQGEKDPSVWSKEISNILGS